MSDVLERNMAVAGLTGATTIRDRIRSYRIGIRSEGDATKSGELLARSLGDILGRFWYNIDSDGCYAEIVTRSARIASHSCRFPSTIRDRWEPCHDFVIGIGHTDIPEKNAVSVGADGWNVSSGNGANLSDNPNPVGPFFAATLAAAEAFKAAFGGSRNRMVPLPPDHVWNSWYGDARQMPEAGDIDLGEIHVFGVGAVSHGALWVMRDWPGRIRGRIHLVDPDTYDVSNAQRYLGMREGDMGMPKVECAAAALQKAHSEIEVVCHRMDMNEYFATENPECLVGLAVCGLDSKDARRQLALKLPRRVVNMWTSGFHAGAARFGFGSGWPCMYCAYPESERGGPDRVAYIHNELGLRPPRARELLYSGMTLDEQDAAVIANHTGMEQKLVVGKTIRTVMGEMCAVGTIVTPQKGEFDATLAPASGIAGAAGFVDLVREVTGSEIPPGHLQVSILAYPNSNSWAPRNPKSSCPLCSDALVLERVREKYENMP